MNTTNRREFIRNTAIAAAGMTLTTNAAMGKSILARRNK